MRLVFIALLTTLTTALAHADTSVWGAHKDLSRGPAKSAETTLGWSYKGHASANFSFSSSQDVVGQTDGSSETYGINLKSSLIHLRAHDEWRNEFSLSESTTKTPNVPRFVKSSDELKLGSTYLYFLPNNPKLGPYARAEAAAPVFKGEDIRSEAKTYRIYDQGGASSSQAASGLRLTDGFRPLTTKEAVGFFYKPIQREDLKVEARLGAAALQIKAAGGYAVKGVNAVGEVEVNPLSDVSQAGVEAALSVKGQFHKNAGYEASIESLTPFVSDKKSGDDRDALRLTNVDGTAKLISQLNSWASMSYDYKLKIQPQLVDRAQQIHMLVLTVNYPSTSEK